MPLFVHDEILQRLSKALPALPSADLPKTIRRTAVRLGFRKRFRLSTLIWFMTMSGVAFGLIAGRLHQPPRPTVLEVEKEDRGEASKRKKPELRVIHWNVKFPNHDSDLYIDYAPLGSLDSVAITRYEERANASVAYISTKHPWFDPTPGRKLTDEMRARFNKLKKYAKRNRAHAGAIGWYDRDQLNDSNAASDERRQARDRASVQLELDEEFAEKIKLPYRPYRSPRGLPKMERIPSAPSF